MTFAAPQWLWALLLLPALASLFVVAEGRSAARLSAFVSPRLLPQLGATVNRLRRALRFGLVLLGLGLAITALAQPRFGYIYEEVKRKGLDLIIAVDTSRSMLANDVPPNRLQQVKLAAQDLIGELRGDRIGVIAFAGRAFLQAPLTIDYDAAVETLNDLDTKVIPEGGTNITEAITLAVNTFGKSAVGNRALIIFTDGEELAGDAVKSAKSAADAGVRVFTVGVGTPEGSLIPLPGQGGGTAFVKDSSGQVVKSKLDEKRLREIAQSTGGVFLPLTSGPATMRQLYSEGVTKMQAGEIDARMSRQPIERYQWPLGAGLIALASSLLIKERKGIRRQFKSTPRKVRALATAAGLMVCAHFAPAASPGLDAYREERFKEAFEQFQQTLQEHPNSSAADKLQFDSGAAAYKMKDYDTALQAFSHALLSPDQQLQSRTHYNLGNTLYQRGETRKQIDEKLKDWSNALQHYEQTLKREPENKEAKENLEFVKNKIEELKKQQKQQPNPTPTPSPSPKPQDKKDQKKDQQQKQQQDQSGQSDEKKPDQAQDQSNEQKKSDNKNDQQNPGATPSPSPDEKEGRSPTPSPSPENAGSPSPSSGEQGQPSPTPGHESATPSPSPGANESASSPSPTPGEGEGAKSEQSSPTPAATPGNSPEKKPSGEVKGAPQDRAENSAVTEPAEVQPEKENQMSQEQAERLLQALKDEEARVQLDERRAVRRVYNDW
ncbi:MAG: VWA domain-containing protein [Chthoniobacterales bacterium]